MGLDVCCFSAAICSGLCSWARYPCDISTPLAMAARALRSMQSTSLHNDSFFVPLVFLDALRRAPFVLLYGSSSSGPWSLVIATKTTETASASRFASYFRIRFPCPVIQQFPSLLSTLSLPDHQKLSHSQPLPIPQSRHNLRSLPPSIHCWPAPRQCASETTRPPRRSKTRNTAGRSAAWPWPRARPRRCRRCRCSG